MRLQLMCLEGIANSLDDDNDDKDDGGCGKGRDHAAAGDDDDVGRGDGLTPSRGGGDGGDGRGREEEAYRWARYTLLSHLGNCLRSDPELCKAMLSMLGGETSVVVNVDKDEDEDDEVATDEIGNNRRRR
jgi:hypothetical protein